MNHTLTILPLLITDLPELRKLSQEIWYAHYSSVLSIEQIEYMLNLMYEAEVITHEINCQAILYNKAIANQLQNQPMVGYLSYGLETTEENTYLKLHKCYLLPALHGYGYGQFLLSHVWEQAKYMNVHKIVLNVNKKNDKAIKAYSRFGFKIISSEIKHIGNGFVMDDYIMAYEY